MRFGAHLGGLTQILDERLANEGCGMGWATGFTGVELTNNYCTRDTGWPGCRKGVWEGSRSEGRQRDNQGRDWSRLKE